MPRTDIIHSDPDILGGKAVFVGTRVPLQALLDYIGGGHTLNEFLADFPSVSRDQAIRARGRLITPLGEESIHDALEAHIILRLVHVGIVRLTMGTSGGGGEAATAHAGRRPRRRPNRKRPNQMARVHHGCRPLARTNDPGPRHSGVLRRLAKPAA